MHACVSAACSCMRCFCRALGKPSCYCDGSLCGSQLKQIAADIESCSGDWKRPILRFSFCKGLHNFRRQIRSLSGEPAMLIGVQQKTKENRHLGHQKPQHFLACRRSQCLRRTKMYFSCNYIILLTLRLTCFCQNFFVGLRPTPGQGSRPGIHSFHSTELSDPPIGSATRED